MAHNRFFLSWRFALLELLLAMPYLFAFHAYTPGLLPIVVWLLGLTLLYSGGELLAGVWTQAKKWQLNGVLTLAAFLFGGLNGGGAVITSILHAGCAAYFLLRPIALTRPKIKANVSPFRLDYIVILYGFGYVFAAFIFPVMGNLAVYAWWTPKLGIAAFILVVWLMNRGNLVQNAHGKTRSLWTTSVLRMNRLIVVVFLAIVFLVALAPAPYKASAVGNGIVHVFDSIRYWGTPSPSTPGHGTVRIRPRPIQALIPPGETSKVALFLETLFLWAAKLAFAGAALVALFFVFMRRGRLWHELNSWFSKRFGRVPQFSAGFTDEHQSLRERKASRRPLKPKKQGRKHLQNGESQDDRFTDNIQRVRNVYRQWVQRLPSKPRPQETPREIGSSVELTRPLLKEETELLQLYEEARYGERNPDDAETDVVQELGNPSRKRKGRFW